MPRTSSDTTDEAKPLNTIPNPRAARCEIIDLESREVWQDFHPTPLDWWKTLSLDAPLFKAGMGSGNMDRMWFRRSPDAEADGPVRTREIAGRDFFYCAKAPADMGKGNPRRMIVDKHHTLVYEAGREVQILSDAEGNQYVLVVEGIPGAPSPKLPDGWALRDMEIKQEWVVALPAPTETYWFEGMISYQGPIENLPGGLPNESA